MTVIAQMLVRNESDRWLRQAMEQATFLADKVVIVDDASDDDTVLVTREYTEHVHGTAVSLFKIDERVQRTRLWDLATAGARRGDWILGFDADELLSDEDLENLKLLLNYKMLRIDSLSFNLVDMWSPTQYRDDAYWTAHQRQWIRAVRYDPSRPSAWRDTTHHCGTFPAGYEGVSGETGLLIRHMGWSRPEDRLAKHRRYMEADPEGQFGWLDQYHSILDDDPRLVDIGPR